MSSAYYLDTMKVQNLNCGVATCQKTLEYPIFSSSEKIKDSRYSIQLVQDGSATGIKNFNESLQMDISYATKRVHFKIFPSDRDRFSVPNNYIYYQNETKFNEENQSSEGSYLKAKVNNNNPFSFQVVRKDTNEVIFDTDLKQAFETTFYYSDKFIQFSTSKSKNDVIYGIGERQADFKLRNGIYTVFPVDQDIKEDIGDPIEGHNLNGYHPFYVRVNSKTNQVTGVYLHSTSALDFIIRDEYVTTRAISGIIDLYVFHGPSFKDVVQQYHELIGKPTLMPFWALGWHQSRWGYDSIQALKSVVKFYSLESIPLDAIWHDKDYTENNIPFKINTENFTSTGMNELNTWLNDLNVKYIVIIDEGISTIDYPPFEEGKRMDIFVRQNSKSDEIVKTRSYYGESTFINYFHQNASMYWENILERMRKKLNFVGIALTSNEPTTLCSGLCGSGSSFDRQRIAQKYSYLPGNKSLEDHTLPMDSYYITNLYNDSNIKNELNFHSLRGIIQSKITFEYLSNYIKRRPFLVSRSTYPGHGKYGGHWLGDNTSTWKDLKFTIPAMFNFHLFGIPFVGSNIWGYKGDATSELWVRWHQLGIFMPFSRNHNSKTSISQEPYSLGSQLKQFATEAIKTKYSFLLYHYALLHQANKEGGAYITPMSYHFAPSTNATIDIFSMQEQMMFGEALLAAPILDHYESRKKIYFPDEDFFNFITGTKVLQKDAEIFIDVDMESVPIYIRAGYIVPYLKFSNQVKKHIWLKKPFKDRSSHCSKD